MLSSGCQAVILHTLAPTRCDLGARVLTTSVIDGSGQSTMLQKVDNGFCRPLGYATKGEQGRPLLLLAKLKQHFHRAPSPCTKRIVQRWPLSQAPHVAHDIQHWKTLRHTCCLLHQAPCRTPTVTQRYVFVVQLHGTNGHGFCPSVHAYGAHCATCAAQLQPGLQCLWVSHHLWRWHLWKRKCE